MAILPHIHSFLRQKKVKSAKKTITRFLKNTMWFALGGIMGLFFFVSFVYIGYQKLYANKVYEGVLINNIDMSGKTKEEVASYFNNRNAAIRDTKISLTSEQATATFSAKQVAYGYDANLLANQAMSIGRGENSLSNMSIMLQAFAGNIILPGTYTFSEEKYQKLTDKAISDTTIEPIDPLFNFRDNKIFTIREGKNGQKVDEKVLQETVLQQLQHALETETRSTITIPLPVHKIEAAIAEEKANSLGIKEVVGSGRSTFKGSIENRAFNINLAASKLNGLLIKPGEVFSFNKMVGDISSLSGYKQAYVIQNGKTVLGDGGGVCQVSTTLFRAALNSGLPIVQRNPHAYRVGYYEQDSGPGVDAAIYTPNIDLQFKNDTNHHLLLQTYVNTATQEMTFTLYGTKDNRTVTVNTPVILSETPAPEPLYQDDPEMPKGQEKQVEFAAPGANVFFTRIVTKDGKAHLNDKFVTNYRPWQAVYLRGTKE